MHGTLTDAELAALRVRSLALLYPSAHTHSLSPLFTRTVLDSCAAGCPLVLSSSGQGLPAGSSGVAQFVSSPETPEAWTSAISAMLDRREVFSARCRAVAARFTWRAYAERWGSILRGPAPSVRSPSPRPWVFLLADAPAEELAPARALAAAVAASGRPVCTLAPDEACAREFAGIGRVEVVPREQMLRSSAALRPSRVIIASLAALADAEPLSSVPHVAIETGWPTDSIDGPMLDSIQGFVHVLPADTFGNPLDAQRAPFCLPPGLRERLIAFGSLVERPALAREQEPSVLVASDLAETLERSLSLFRHQYPSIPIRRLDRAGDPRVSIDELVAHVARAHVLLTPPNTALVAIAVALGTRAIILGPGAVALDGDPAFGDRTARALELAGLADVLQGKFPPESLVRRLHEAIRLRPRPALPDGAPTAVEKVASLQQTVSRVWRPLHLRP